MLTLIRDVTGAIGALAAVGGVAVGAAYWLFRTTAAGPDMRPIHDRQPVILPRGRWRDWLDLSGDPAPLYRPGPLGTLRAEVAPAEGALL
jgi:putative SOS response-associated peptidase YedK